MFNFLRKTDIDETLEEQKADVLKFPERMMVECLKGNDCDQILGGKGEFGYTSTNPIPVNGPTGEIKYINRLRTKTGRAMIYHRIGSLPSMEENRQIDVYEMVSMDGNVWDILYLDMYHPRRSTLIPKGYTFSKFNKMYDRLPIGFGSNKRDVTFPFGVGILIERDYAFLDGVISSKRLAQRYNEIVADREKFVRPKIHEDKLREVIKSLSNSSYYGIDVKFP